jgi:AAA15 family ATPase/GTPase
MVERLKIQNYKSIRNLDLPCKKANVFIGEPNSGKSNIIEALSILSQDILNTETLKQVIRFKDIGGLFFDYNFNQPIVINTGLLNASLKYDIKENGTIGSGFLLTFDPTENKNDQSMYVSHEGNIQSNQVNFPTPFLLYEYKRLANFQKHYLPHLAPPYGNNLPTILLGNPELKKWVSDFFRSKGFKMILKPLTGDIEITKEVDDNEYSFPYLTISETLQRVVFYMMAMESNKNRVLLFDEPDSNTFPFYTKFLGERIALDETNQFFITTHNPYLLLNLIEKSASDDINVCVAQMKNYETVITVLNDEQISQVLDLNSDLFFNLDILTEA